MKVRVDLSSPIPRYHQIAESIRHSIATGSIRPGDQLPPIRKAARDWGVNMHTVRKSYAVLAEEGLVTMVPHRGTIVREENEGTDVLEWLSAVLAHGQRAYQLGPQQLLELLHQQLDVDVAVPLAHVVECSHLQAADHAAELESMFSLNAVPHAIDDLVALPDHGTIIATYFHYNDLRLRWPDGLRRIQFVPIHPDPGLKRAIRSNEAPLLVVELSDSKAEHIAADISRLFPLDQFRIVRAVWQPGQALPNHPGPVLFPPRVWALLDPAQRALESHYKVRYVIAHDDLVQLGITNHWPLRSATR